MKTKTIFITTLILILIGITMIYSSTSTVSLYKYGYSYKFFLQQSIFSIIGFFLMTIISKIDYNLLKKYSNLFLFISIILLILVLIPGLGSVRNGSRSWFSIGPFGLQPSELAKITLIIFVSKYISNNDNEMKNVKKGTLPILLVIFLVFFLILLEPDFGSGMILMLSVFALLFTSKIKTSFFYKCGLLGIIGIVLLIIIAPYRMKRIVSYLNPWVDPLGSGFQIIQSLYAISPSGIFGYGLGSSIQKQFYLPEPGTDFIFAIMAEELGFMSIIILTVLYMILFISTIKISICSKDLFAKYLSIGLILEIIIQAILNILVVVGLIPVTGVTLPFISYGGSSLLISMISIGIILSISKSLKN